MPYAKCKIYSDGSHYIAIPHKPQRPRPKKGAKVRKEVPELEELEEDEAADCPFDKPAPPEPVKDPSVNENLTSSPLIPSTFVSAYTLLTAALSPKTSILTVRRTSSEKSTSKLTLPKRGLSDEALTGEFLLKVKLS